MSINIDLRPIGIGECWILSRLEIQIDDRGFCAFTDSLESVRRIMAKSGIKSISDSKINGGFMDIML